MAACTHVAWTFRLLTTKAWLLSLSMCIYIKAFFLELFVGLQLSIKIVPHLGTSLNKRVCGDFLHNFASDVAVETLWKIACPLYVSSHCGRVTYHLGQPSSIRCIRMISWSHLSWTDLFKTVVTFAITSNGGQSFRIRAWIQGALHEFFQFVRHFDREEIS